MIYEYISSQSFRLPRCGENFEQQLFENVCVLYREKKISISTISKLNFEVVIWARHHYPLEQKLWVIKNTFLRLHSDQTKNRRIVHDGLIRSETVRWGKLVGSGGIATLFILISSRRNLRRNHSTQKLFVCCRCVCRSACCYVTLMWPKYELKPFFCIDVSR